jgi:hypothetical protein
MFRSFRSALLPIAGLVAIVAIAAVAGYATKPSGTAQSVPAVADDTAQTTTVRGIVQEVSGGNVTLTTADGQRSFRLAPTFAVEMLTPLTRSQISPGDWLNAGASPHDRSLFFITGLIVIPDSQLAGPR